MTSNVYFALKSVSGSALKMCWRFL